MVQHETTVRQFFKEQFLDNKAISQKFIDTWKGKQHGNKPVGVPTRVVGDLTFTYNGRRPTANKIKQYIEKHEGIDWFLHGALNVAKIGDKEDLWDSLHRAIIDCVVLGPDAEVPALVTEFNDGKEVHSNFHEVNGGSAKHTTPEQSFISQMRGKRQEPETRNIYDLLESTGNVSVYENDDLYEPQHATVNWSVNVGPCRQMLTDIKDRKDILKGFDMYKDCFESTYKGKIKPYKMLGQLLGALIFLNHENKSWLSKEYKGKSNAEYFVDWMKDSIKVKPKLAEQWLFRNYMHDRQEKRYLGTAKGIWEGFMHFYIPSVSKNQGHKATEDAVEKAYLDSLKPKKKKLKKAA